MYYQSTSDIKDILLHIDESTYLFLDIDKVILDPYEYYNSDFDLIFRGNFQHLEDRIIFVTARRSEDRIYTQTLLKKCLGYNISYDKLIFSEEFRGESTKGNSVRKYIKDNKHINSIIFVDDLQKNTLSILNTLKKYDHLKYKIFRYTKYDEI